MSTALAAGPAPQPSIPGIFGALLAVLVATLLCGSFAQRLGQPRVAGEMLAGILLGPSLFGWLAPGAFEWLFPAEVQTAIYLLSQLGLVLFMFLVGAGLRSETNGRSTVQGAVAVGIAGVVIPFALSFTIAWVVAEAIAPPQTPRLQLALLLGAALSVTAFPVLARMVVERGMERSSLGATAMLAASVDDAAAWILLAVTAAAAGRNSGAEIGVSLIGGALFVLVMLGGVRRALAPLARYAERRGEVTIGVLAVLLIVVLAAASITDLLGLHVAFGAFVAGIALPESGLVRERVQTGLSDINVGLLLPLFFVHTGLQTRMQELTDPTVLVPVVLVLLTAFAGKYLGCTLTLRAQGHPWRRASAIGGLMDARGLMVLIFAQIAADLGLVSQDLFTILVLLALITSAVAMPIYRLSLPARFEVERARGPAPPGASVTSLEHPVTDRPATVC
ncbi:cation:proton antiporter [Salinifilum ghardaiensis]